MSDSVNTPQQEEQPSQAELEEIRHKVLEMGGMVESQVAGAVRAMTQGDLEVAAEIVARDCEINAMEIALDEECTQILAQKLADFDLRLVIAVIKTITDLERIGDEAERVARMAKYMGGDRFQETVMLEFEHMGEIVRRMLNDVLDAFARMDSQAAGEVVAQDLKVDTKYESLTRQLITHMAEDPRAIPAILNILWAARAIERIGDRCQNIAEYVIYLVKGKDVRHTTLQTKLDEAGR